MIELTKHQAQITSEVIKAIDSYGVAYLSGPAGTGKTTCVKELVKNYTKVEITATTNEAAGVLSASGIKAKTLDSLLGNRMFYDELNFSERMFYSQTFEHILPETLIVIDEASMVNDKQADQLEKLLHNGINILFVGDANQLKPVSKTGAIPRFVLDAPTFMLTQQMRQADGSELHTLLTKIAYGIEHKFDKAFSPKLIKDTEGIIITTNRREFVSMADSTDNAMVLTYRNKTVDRYNDALKKSKELINAGDIVKLTRPVYNDEGIVHQNRESVKILTCEKRMIGSGKTITSFTVTTDKATFTIIPSKLEWDKLRLQLKSRKMYKDGITFHQSYATASLGYAGTVHKSQGRTMDYAFYDLTDAWSSYQANYLDDYSASFRNPISADDYNRMLYVALSRARKGVVILLPELTNRSYTKYKKEIRI